eukprot:CAMPEP_0115171058 /NCGR_PEP_ID=MMETSP0270-20121206/2110_1 /TAXON_ID=71861 /ORGANISM="Scrippsiella trochoidea, Strain CCMP3099" /LENGTH=206 /DNA_ID=CAMNT_0002583819 /DNA_START=575 /DNA_END=1195 /DNA_ORIENTATION=-
MHKLAQGLVHVHLHVSHWDVITDVVHAPETQNRREANDSNPYRALDKQCDDKCRDYPMDHQHQGDNLGKGKRHGEVVELLRVVQDDNSIAQLVVDAREDRRCYLEDVGIMGLHNQSLDPLKNDFTFVVAPFQELQALQFEVVKVDKLKGIALHLRHLAEGSAVEQAYQADEPILEEDHIILLVRRAVAESDATTERIEPLSTQLLQ